MLKRINLNYYPGSWEAAQYGFISMSFDPAIAFNNVTALSLAGRMYLIRLYLPQSSTISNVITYLVGAGSGLTSGQCKAALYDSAGNLAGTTADQSTDWASTGLKTMAITPVTLSSGYIWYGMYYNGTTGPSLMRGASSSASALGMTGVDQRNTFGSTTGLTTSPAATNVGGNQSSTMYWAAVS